MMQTLEREITTSRRVSDTLSLRERALLRGQVMSLSENYNIPGVSTEIKNVALEDDDNFVVVSQVGGSTISLEIGGEDVYFSGQNPYGMPYLDQQKKLQLGTPRFYRYIGQDIIPVANEFIGFNEIAHKNLERITGQEIRRYYDTGHHGDSQIRIGEITKSENVIVYRVKHIPDVANLFALEQVKTVGFDGEWFREEISLTNPNRFSIPVSVLRHPYFAIPSEGFNQATVSLVSGKGKPGKLFNLKDYAIQGEQRISGIPLINDGQVLEFNRGDGVSFQIAFDGDYEQEKCGIQFFSNGYSEEEIKQDFQDKHVIHEQRLYATAHLLNQLGIDASWYDPQTLKDESFLHDDMLCNMRSVCIEDNTSEGNIYCDKDANPVILLSQQSKTYVRMTRRVS